MLTNIYYFVDERGRNAVREFIDNLPVKEQAKVFAYIEELKRQGHNLRRPLADYLRNDIYELRPKRNRIFYFFFLKNEAVLVHAVQKKSRKIAKKDLELSVKRKNQVLRLRNMEKVYL